MPHGEQLGDELIEDLDTDDDADLCFSEVNGHGTPEDHRVVVSPRQTRFHWVSSTSRKRCSLVCRTSCRLG
jgi:hypothetical protein